MPYELGGRADKSGNRYEIRMVIYHLLAVIQEKISYVILEALGEDEKGIDIWIRYMDGIKEGQQCKGRNSSKEHWDFGSANAKNIFSTWKRQLDRDSSIIVSLVSPLPFTMLDDLINRAKNTNSTPIDFYENQIQKSSKEFNTFFNNFCNAMILDPKKEFDLIRCIDYLNRIKNRKFSDTELKDIIFDKINYLFLDNEQYVYDRFVSWIVDEDILGKELNQTILYKFLDEKDIKLKNLSLDKRIIPKILDLNNEYQSAFKPLNNGIFYRDEFIICREAIELGKSLIIHGKAGRGKSGCTEDIIKYCKEKNIRYLAIKLDKRIPAGTAERWGQDLGFPTSIVHCIHSVTSEEKAVIILDQLDALRWTQVHSREALLVCSQIINQVKQLNYERKHNISIVFVCRTYDLENDNNIKDIFKVNNGEKDKLEWQKILIGEINDKQVEEIVGLRYKELTSKLQELLKIPSNLYIWQHLEPINEYNEISTTNNLVTKWWEQLTQKYFDLGSGVSERELNVTKDELIEQIDKLGGMSVPKKILNANQSILDYLSSNGFLVIQENKIFFTHQSILDCFLAEKMVKQFYSGVDLTKIIGDKEKQTPGRRYQVQMLMQSLSEISSKDFIKAGQKILNIDSIRYCYKFIFFEVLNQLEKIDKDIEDFIIENCENEKWGKNIVNNVISSNKQYFTLLRDAGVLDKWFNNSEKKDIVFKLLASICPKYDIEDIDFIKKYLFKKEEDDNKFSQCFYNDINEDSDEMFDLRIRFYQRYPQMLNRYVDFKLMLKNCEIRTIRYFAELLKYKLNSNKKTSHQYENYFLFEDSDISIKNGIEVIELLLHFIPKENYKDLIFSNWSGQYQKSCIERSCVNIIKKANAAIISMDPNKFWDYNNEFIGKCNYVYNEIALDALAKLPETSSDKIIKYLLNDFENNIFDKTSGNGDELFLAKLALGKHSKFCSAHLFDQLENKIIHYISSDAKDRYERRINYNKEKNGYIVYWSFWGDLQYELLNILPFKRLSSEAKNLLHVLNRKFENKSTKYKYSDGHSGWVGSPIAGKKLTDMNWLRIITNKKIKNKKNSNWKEVPGGFIESSIEQFSISFRNAVTENPERMINLILSMNESIEEIYIKSLFEGIAYSDYINSISNDLIESIILKYPCFDDYNRANSILTIIKKKENIKWSKKILDIIIDIAGSYKDSANENSNIISLKDTEMRKSEMLHINAINSIQGQVAQVIGHLLWNDENYFEQFKDIIESLTLDKNPAIRLASFFALWPSYKINKEWATPKILKLYEQDYSLAVFSDTKNILFFLYPEYRKQVLKIIKKCYKSMDEDLIRIGSHCLAEMYILKNEFVCELNNVKAMSIRQAEEVLNMAILYFDKDNYNKLIKKIIYKFKKSRLDLRMPISRLYYNNLINLERDKDFLLNLMSSELGYKTINAFVHYLEEESQSLVEFKDIIISLSYNIIENNRINRSWEIDNAISKLVIGLYDQVSGRTDYGLQKIANECLDLWDKMFEKQIGSAKKLSKEMMER